MKPKNVVVNDKMQKKYTYARVEPIGENFDKDFKPQLTPSEMLALGVFGGVYMRDCIAEFPKSWFTGVKFAPKGSYLHDPRINFFQVNASQSLKEWQEKGWIYHEDPRGWFQWYCRYYMGRRIPNEDKRQIKRWIMMRRHATQVVKNCRKGDIFCRKRQRQALLHWAYDSRKL